LPIDPASSKPDLNLTADHRQRSFMPHTDRNIRTPATTAVVLGLLLACLGLAACGGSSKSSSTSTNAAATTTATSTTGTTGATTGTTGTSTTGTGAKGATGAKGPNAGRFTALRECLQKNGITLPQRAPGQRHSPGAAGGFLDGGAGAGPQLPKGVTRAQYEAALKKCGGGNSAGRGPRFDSPTFKAALAKFATCLRQNGVNVPAPDTSGKGPVFNTKGINTGSAQFKAAESKCQSDLSGAFRHGSSSGAGGPGGGNGGAPSGGGEAPPAG
jgi:hypothetical protein